VGEIIPDKEPKLPLGGGWKIAIVFMTVLLAVGSMGWQIMDDGSKGTLIVLAAFTAFGWFVWLTN
jgi:hypothetical protein